MTDSSDGFRANDDRSVWAVLLGGLVLGLGFLWIPYALRMWNTGHYQYFPWVFLAVGGLLWSRRTELIAARSEPDRRIVGGVLLGLIVVAAGANLLYSSFAGIAMTVAAIWLGMYALFGLRGVWAAFPVLLLLFFAIPLPMNWDEALVVGMQLWASDLAGQFLDGLGVIHFRQGVILQTQQTQFLTEEACSGVRSLFSSWAAVAILGVALRHRWWRIAINLSQAVFWVIVGNVLRIVAVVALSDRLPWIASGTGHEVLGLAVFAFILAMIFCTDWALSTLIGQELVVDTEAEAPVFRAGQVSAFRLPAVPLDERMRRAVAIGLAVLVLVSVRAQWVRAAWASGPALGAGLRMTPPQQSDLPEQSADYTLDSFEHISRGPNFLWAQDSYVWHYADESTTALISFDTPWNEWHNLNVCYRNLGWQTEASFSLESPASTAGESDAAIGHRHSELLMRRPGQYGFVVFSAIDRRGGHVQELYGTQTVAIATDPRLLALEIRAALGLGGERGNTLTPDRLPVATVQLHAVSAAPWTDAQLESLRRLFFASRAKLIEQRRGSAEGAK